MAAQRNIGRVVVVTAVCLTIGLAILVLRRLERRPRTTDAQVTANTIQIAPEVEGRIATLNVKDEAIVHKGDVLFTIEALQYELDLAAAKAKVQTLEAQLGLTRQEVSSEKTGVSVAQAEAQAARAKLEEATKTLRRKEPLLAKRYVTPQEVDEARSAKATAESELRAAALEAEQARQGVGNIKPLAAELEGARAEVGQAERNLRNTVVRAPFDGRIVGVTTQVGQLVSSSHALFTLIDTSQWYIVGDFREGQLKRIRPGEKVTGYVMSAPDVHLQGTVQSVGSAVAQGDSVAGVPQVERDLNWVVIAQRFPVRVALQNPPPELMRIGASAVVVVMTGDEQATDEQATMGQP